MKSEFDTAPDETPQWKLWVATQFGRDLRVLTSPFKAFDRSDTITVIHLGDAHAQAQQSYWAPFDRRATTYLPRHFGVYVRRTARNLPNAVLVVALLGGRRFSIIKLAFEWEDELEAGSIGSEDIRACPLDRWARLAASAILHKARHNHPAPGQTTLYGPHEQQVHYVEALAMSTEVVARSAMSRRRDTTRKDIEEVARIYLAELNRYKREGGRCRPTFLVQEELGLKPSTAKRRIKRAHELGLLGPARGTRVRESRPQK
jgi:hypothetical protein